MPIEEYLQSVREQNPKADTSRMRGYITHSAEFFAREGIETPAEKDYQALREYFSQPNDSGATLGESAISKRVNETRKFYAWLMEHKPSQSAIPVKKRGRPKKVYAPGEEGRNKKYSMYFPESLYEAMNDLAHFNRKTVADILVELSHEYVERNAKKLEIFRNAIASAEALEP